MIVGVSRPSRVGVGRPSRVPNGVKRIQIYYSVLTLRGPLAPGFSSFSRWSVLPVSKLRFGFELGFVCLMRLIDPKRQFDDHLLRASSPPPPVRPFDTRFDTLSPSRSRMVGKKGNLHFISLRSRQIRKSYSSKKGTSIEKS
jgi:hypothetical protein